jgi:hypothetical protein
MNEWTKKSFKLHESLGYLDHLSTVYPMKKNDKRELNPKFKKSLKECFDSKDDQKLFELLLPLKKFPVKDSYKAYFSRTPKSERHEIIEKNPETVHRICERIYRIGYERMIQGLEAPKETNRQIGPMFTDWIRNEYPSYKNINHFLNSDDYISILSGSDDKLVKFAKNKLNINLPKGRSNQEKGLDMVAKIETKPTKTFVIGEAKFLTDFGGHQNSQLRDALQLIVSPAFKNEGKYKIKRIAILDGVCWIDSKNTKMQKDLRKLKDNQIAISSLLLDDFFKSLD